MHGRSAGHHADTRTVRKKAIRYAIPAQIRNSTLDSGQYSFPNHLRLLHNLFFHIKRIAALAAPVHIPVHRQPFRFRSFPCHIVQFHTARFQHGHIKFRQHKIFLRILPKHRHIRSQHTSALCPGNDDRAHVPHCKNSSRNILKHDAQGKSSLQFQHGFTNRRQRVTAVKMV